MLLTTVHILISESFKVLTRDGSKMKHWERPAANVGKKVLNSCV